MSERFVFVMSVKPGAIEALVGSKQKASKILSKAPKAFRDELRDFFEDEELGDIEALVQQILDGTPDKTRAYEYGRLVEVLSCAVGKRIAVLEVVMTYGMPRGGAGCWNRALRELELPLLAKHWAQDNLFFPFKTNVRRSVSDWPIRTRWTNELRQRLLKELSSSKWTAALKNLPASVLADARADSEAVEATRDELRRGLLQLKKCLAKAGELVLVMDGSQ
jgi:hypothetical protein